jgi:hypothetical protein
MVSVKNQTFWHIYAVLTGKYKILLLWHCERGYNKQRAGREWFRVRLNVELLQWVTHTCNGSKSVRFLSLGGILRAVRFEGPTAMMFRIQVLSLVTFDGGVIDSRRFGTNNRLHLHV